MTRRYQVSCINRNKDGIPRNSDQIAPNIMVATRLGGAYEDTVDVKMIKVIGGYQNLGCFELLSRWSTEGSAEEP